MAARGPSGAHEKGAIELETQTGAADSIERVINGQQAFGVTTGIAYLTAISNGAPIVTFGAGLLESPVVFYTLESSGIRSPRDFLGKRVARQAGTDAAVIYDAVLANLGLSRSQVQEISGEGDVADLASGRIDVLPGYLGKEGYQLRQRGVAYYVIVPADYGIHVPGTVYFARLETVSDHATVTQRLLRAMIAGWNAAYSDYSKSVPIIAAATGLASEQVQFELDAQRDIVRPVARRVGEFDDMQWKQLRIILLNERMIKESIDMSRAINYDFLREAYRKPLSFGN